MQTSATEMFGIDVPIFAFSHCRDVVVAVSRAGGLGVLGAAGHSDEELEIDLAWIDAELGDRPYGVDIIVPEKYAGQEKGGLSATDVQDLIPEGHRVWLDDLLKRFDVPELPDEDLPDSAGGTTIFSAARGDAQLEIVLAHRAALVVNALGPPPQWMIDRCKAADRRIGALAGSAHHAARHVEAGVDLIVAQGSEAGGHTGEIGSMVLIPEIVDAVAPTPVLGAGGIGRGRQMAAAMALGAAGVWCGSVWLTTEEAETNEVVKKKMLDATSADTIRSRSRTGKHSRQLRSAWTEAWESPDAPPALGMPMQLILVANALRRIDRAAHRPGSGAEQLANYFVGQVVGTMNQSKSATEVVHDMMEEFIDSIESLSTLLSDAR